MIRFLMLLAVGVVIALPAEAQRPSRDLIVRYEAMVGEIEASTYNRALPLFADQFWGFRQIQVAQRGAGGELDPDSADPGIASRLANESLRRNLPELEKYVQTLCRRLTPAQSAFLEDYARQRYAALAGELAARRATIAQKLSAPVDSIDPAAIQLAVVNDCSNRAEAGPGVIQVSRELLLTALLSSMFADAQLYIIPERSLKAMQDRIQGARTGVDPARARPLLDRVRQTAAWQQFVRARRQLEGDVAKPLDRFEEEDIFGSLARRPDCASAPERCRLMLSLAYSFLSTEKFELYFREQVDFIIGHEFGHHALGHVAKPLGTCAVERDIEAAADRFAVALTRPDDGFFAPAAGASVATGAMAEVVETRFASGLDLFMVQSHRIAGLPNGNGCAYPTFQQRQVAARAFEEQAYPRTRAQMAKYASRSVAGTWRGHFTTRNGLVEVTAILRDTPTGGFVGEMVETGREGSFTSIVTGRARLNSQIAFQKTYDGKDGRNYGVAHAGHLLGPNTMAGQWRLADGTTGSFSFDRQR
jgi:hypothetical protein